MSNVSSIREFYSDKTVFVTGATGFLGKFIVEKLLYSTNVSKIYVLIRCKRGMTINERFEKYKNDQIFKFRTTKNMTGKLFPISGDVCKEGLDIHPDVVDTILSEVDVVIHSAASVRFNEPLSDALTINVCGPIEVLKLCQKINNLKSMIHVSTAFANAHMLQSGELYNPMDVNVYELLDEMKNQSNKDVFNDVAYSRVIGNHPNTYTLTKNLAEQVVKDMSLKYSIPCAIVRPSIIIAPVDASLEYYVDTISQGSSALIANVAVGLNRVIPGRKDGICNCIPVDKVANGILLLAWKVACEKSIFDSDEMYEKIHEPKIYGLYSNSDFRYPMGLIVQLFSDLGNLYPSIKTIRPPTTPILALKDSITFKSYNFIYNTMFALMIDLILSGKKKRLSSAMGVSVDVLDKISIGMTYEWKNHGSSVNEVMKQVSDEEKNIFYYEDENFSEMDQMKYLMNFWLGIRKWALKEPDSNMREARKRLNRMKKVYKVIEILFFIILLLTIYGILF